jgi:hypothetical protein
MANRSDVRQALQLQGLDIPDTTIFVGGFHNTCSDGVEIFDENLIPDSHRRVFERLQEVIFEARGRNALERCRRFPLANVKTPAQALRHVQERTSNIAEPRPEYGHATNAICVVGRRSLTRDLFLDRRAFLVSYDPDGDSDGSLLAGTLAAVIPVCMGINLEYFFSSLDNETYGAGTKLPHNVACLLGIMTGYCSDLRTGLPQQMIEIHEPVRLVTLVDAPRASLESIMSANSTLRRIFLRGWVLLQRFDDDLGVIEMLQEDGTWKLIRSSNDVAHPLISSSMDWMSGTIDNLPFATRLRGQFHFDQATGGTFDLDSKEVR